MAPRFMLVVRSKVDLEPGDWQALAVSLRLAAVAVAGLLVLGAPLAWWLSRSRSRWKAVVEAIVALPLVLPPSVLGFYLLVLLSPEGPFGRAAGALGLAPLAFSFRGLVVGAMIHSLPFVVQPLQSAFSGVDRRLLEAAATLGAGPLDRFFSVVVPNSVGGWMSAVILGFAHTMGEFGVVLMIGGSLPGETRVASIAIYHHVEAMDYDRAHQLAGALLALSLCLMLAVFWLRRRGRAA